MVTTMRGTYAIITIAAALAFGAAAIMYASYMSSHPDYIDPSDPEIKAVLAYIKSTWPKQALNAQKEVTLQADQ